MSYLTAWNIVATNDKIICKMINWTGCEGYSKSFI